MTLDDPAWADARAIAERVCEERGVELDSLFWRARQVRLVDTRHAIWAALRETDPKRFSLEVIGALFERHHTTVLHGLRTLRPRGPSKCQAAGEIEACA